MARELRTETNANVVMSASRLVPLRRMATVKPRKPPKPPKPPVVRPLFISERTKRLPQSWRGWAVCGLLLVIDVVPFAFLFWRFA